MEDADLSALVAAAVTGDRGAWDELVHRFSGLVWAIARSYRMRQQDVEDVSQTVWLLLSTSLRQLRDPDALPGWLGTTTRRECARLVRKAWRERPLEVRAGSDEPPNHGQPTPEEAALRSELRHEVRTAFRQLGERCRQLLSLLVVDPPMTYRAIGAALDMPLGSVGPTRGRCLDELRKLSGLSSTNS
jgi:RNA polymerase sigma factor (sigma-70 family)